MGLKAYRSRVWIIPSLFVLTASLFLTTLPCFCFGDCSAHRSEQQHTTSGDEIVSLTFCGSGAARCDHSFEAADSQKISSGCGCEVPAQDRLIRFKSFQSDWWSQAVPAYVEKVSGPDRVLAGADVMGAPNNTHLASTPIPSYLLHVSFLL